MNTTKATLLSLMVIGSAVTITSRATDSTPAGGDPSYWKFAPTPPMGWNSFDSFGASVTETEVLSNARYIRDHLLRHGWQYVVVDYRWYDPVAATRVGTELTMDDHGRLLPSQNRFPSAQNGGGFKAIADQVHGMGLKFGIHIMRGIPRQAVKANTPIEGSSFKAADAADTGNVCAWCADMYGVKDSPAGKAWYDSIIRLYAQWGVDFIKVDDLSMPYSAAEIEAIRKVIDTCGRAIVFSTSPGDTPLDKADHIKTHANMWRISGDFWDQSPQLRHTFDLLERWQTACGPGHWPDADMIPFGHIGERSEGGPRWTRFTRDEQVTLMTLWCIARSPLMLGANLNKNDDWTLSLLTNDEVLAVNQHSTGGRQLFRQGNRVAWVADAPDSKSRFLALFDLGDPAAIDVKSAAYRSELITRQTKGHAVDIDVDITGAKKLYLVVDDGDDGYACDHADWIEPRLIGPAGEVKLTSLKWVSATSGWGTAVVGKSVSGGKPVVGGTEVTDVIGTHSQSVIEYELPDGYTRFKARGGLDQGGTTQAIAGSTVHFMIFTKDPHGINDSAITVALQDLGITGICHVRDLWQRKDLGVVSEKISASVPPSGAVLLKLTP